MMPQPVAPEAYQLSAERMDRWVWQVLYCRMTLLRLPVHLWELSSCLLLHLQRTMRLRT